MPSPDDLFLLGPAARLHPSGSGSGFLLSAAGVGSVRGVDPLADVPTHVVEAEAIRLVNEAANRYFVGNAQLLRKLETLERALRDNAKIVLPGDAELVNVIGDLAGVLPLKTGPKREEILGAGEMNR